MTLLWKICPNKRLPPIHTRHASPHPLPHPQHSCAFVQERQICWILSRLQRLKGIRLASDVLTPFPTFTLSFLASTVGLPVFSCVYSRHVDQMKRATLLRGWKRGEKKNWFKSFWFFICCMKKKPHNNHALAKVCMSAGDNLDRCPWTFSPSQSLMPISFSFSPFLFSQSSLWKMHLRFSWHSDNKRAAWAAGKSCAWWWVGDKEVATVSEITDTSGTSSRYLLISDE